MSTTGQLGLPGTLYRRRPERQAAGVVLGDRVLVLRLPIRTVSEANAHEHWRCRATRAKRQRSQTALLLRATFGPTPPLPPLTITLTRISPGRLDDDNLASSQKHIRDGVADWLGIDDGDSRLSWRYEQGTGRPCVVIRVEARI